MTRRFQANVLERLVANIFEAHGTPFQEAQTVARLLVQADLMGLPSPVSGAVGSPPSRPL